MENFTDNIHHYSKCSKFPHKRSFTFFVHIIFVIVVTATVNTDFIQIIISLNFYCVNDHTIVCDIIL